MNVLKGTTGYLVGSIESAKDSGKGWRVEVKTRLKKLGIKILDPCDKQFLKDIKETDLAQGQMKAWRAAGDMESLKKLQKAMKEIRIYDLKCVDICDFLFCFIDLECPTYGSWEEISWGAGRLKKPTFFVCKQGVKNAPLWMFGMIPPSYFYDSIQDALIMIEKINRGEVELDSDRWKLLSPAFYEQNSNLQNLSHKEIFEEIERRANLSYPDLIKEYGMEIGIIYYEDSYDGSCGISDFFDFYFIKDGERTAFQDLDESIWQNFIPQYFYKHSSNYYGSWHYSGELKDAIEVLTKYGYKTKKK